MSMTRRIKVAHLPDAFAPKGEAHRTQEGDLGRKMREALPNASLFGLTGTPTSNSTTSFARAKPTMPKWPISSIGAAFQALPVSYLQAEFRVRLNPGCALPYFAEISTMTI
jgi:SWI2/SNF2 ATPase